MRQPKYILSANDNAPLRTGRAKFGLKSTSTVSSTSPSNVVSKHKQKQLLAWLLPIVSCLLGAYALSSAASIAALILPAMTIALLLFWTAVRAERHSRLRNISGLLFIAAATVALGGTAAENGFSLIGVELAIMVSGIALIIGWVLMSRPSVMLSGLAALTYLANLFPEFGLLTGLAEQRSQLGIAILPVLLFGQATLAQRLRSPALITIVISASYIWMFAIAKNMPLPALAGIGFAVTAAHYCLGKAWANRGAFAARLHSSFALTLAIIAALYIQSLWMVADSGQATPFWPPNTLWWITFGGAIFALFVSSLMRYKTSQISLTGIFIICLAATALPLTTAKPDLFYTLFDFIPGLDARPGLGLIIGAVIIASGVNWIVTGLKTGQLSNIVIGAIAIGVEGLILYQPSRFNMDVGVVLIVSLICALCVGGLIAGSTGDQSRNSHHYA